MSTHPDPADLLALAVAVAREAGDLLVNRRPSDLGVAATKSSPTDVVTVMDTAAERLIVDRLLGARPRDGVLGEEGAAGAGSSGVRWVLDPIDGTVNYLYNLHHWAVSVAAECDGQTLAGVVHAPRLGQTFTAVRGEGASCNGEPVRASSCSDLAGALVATGFGYAARRRAHQAEVLTGVLPRVRDVRRNGAASVDLCAVAAGRVDAYYERGLKAWDLAAGALVAQEAGVRVEGLHGRAAGEDFMLAAPPGLFAELHDLLAALEPDRD